MERDMWNVMVVMFAPNTISSGDAAPRRSAAAAWASRCISSDRRLVTNEPPSFAFIPW